MPATGRHLARERELGECEAHGELARVVRAPVERDARPLGVHEVERPRDGRRLERAEEELRAGDQAHRGAREGRPRGARRPSP